MALTDTSDDVARRQRERLREMSLSERGDLLAAMCNDVTELALAGIRREHPDATPSEIRRHLLLRRYGSSFVDSLPPEAL